MSIMGLRDASASKKLCYHNSPGNTLRGHFGEILCDLLGQEGQTWAFSCHFIPPFTLLALISK